MTKIANFKSLGEIDRFQRLVDAIKDYAIYMLDVDGHVISWNSGAESVKGYSELEILGRHFSCFYTAEDIADGLPFRALSTARDEGRFECEGWRLRKDGTRFQAHVVIDPIWQEEQLIGFAEITRDISQKVKADFELQTARESLQQAQKMEVLGRLTSGVAHDFNNMIMVLRSSAERLMRPDLSEEDRARSYELMNETIDHATKLTEQLLTFARRQPLRPEQFDVIERILAVRPLLEMTLTDAVTLRMQLAPDLTPIDTDRHQFETAIINLVVNARDAVLRSTENEGGKPVVTVSALPVNGIPAVRGHSPVSGAYVAISVTDNGPGIPDDVMPHIFEPFFTTKEKDAGTGLGLSQVYGFVKQTGGEIEAANQPGHGVRFTLYLPRVQRRIVTALTVATKSIPIVEEPKLTGSVLLVEDNGRIAEVTLSLLDDLGLQADWASDAEVALAKLEDPEKQFDLVLTDVVMPGLSGIALGRAIAKRWPALPVILTSGYSDDLTAGQGGEFMLIQKPYNRKALISALGHHLQPAAA